MSLPISVITSVQKELKLLDSSNPVILCMSSDIYNILLGPTDFNELDVTTQLKISRYFFSDVRCDGENITGARLTKLGLVIVGSVFKNYEFKFEKRKSLTPRYIITFNKICTMPWYIDSSRIVFFEGEVALRYKLVGDIDQFMVAFDDYTI